jgi:hypothetical protein
MAAALISLETEQRDPLIPDVVAELVKGPRGVPNGCGLPQTPATTRTPTQLQGRAPAITAHRTPTD